MIIKRREYRFTNFHDVDSIAAKFVFYDSYYNINMKKSYAYSDQKTKHTILYR